MTMMTSLNAQAYSVEVVEDNEPARENDKILELQKEVNELKNIIRKANQMVPPPMKEMLPQDMKNAMDKVGQ